MLFLVALIVAAVALGLLVAQWMLIFAAVAALVWLTVFFARVV